VSVAAVPVDRVAGAASLVEPVDVGPRFEGPRAVGPRLAWHALALAVILTAVAAFVGPGLFSGDEGAALAQAKVLATSGGWGIDAPLPGADPDGTRFPIDKAEPIAADQPGGAATTVDPAPRRFAPLPRHALYPWMLSRFGADHLAGAAVALSMIGTWIAALGAALLARRSGLADARITLWATAIATPLLFDGTVAAAHTLVAAAVSVGVLAGWTCVTGSSSRPWWAWAALALTTALAVALRNEATLLVIAVAAVIAFAAVRCIVVRRRQPTRPTRPTLRLPSSMPSATRLLCVAGMVVVAGAATFRIDRMVTEHITGAVHGVVVPASGSTDSGMLGARVDGIFTTLLRLSYFPRPISAVVLAFTALLALGMVVAIVRGTDVVRPLAWLTIVAALFAMVAPRPSAVPGLFVACPLLVIGIALGAPSAPRRWLRAGVLLFAAIVALTQYAEGGGAEWGWRYVALVIPVATPLALAGLSRVVDLQRHGANPATGPTGPTSPTVATARSTGRVFIVALCAVSMAGTVVSVRALHGHRARSAARVEAVAEVAAGTTAGDGGLPVVVSPLFSLGRFSWDHLEAQRQLRLSATEDLNVVAQSLRAAGVSQFVYVGNAGEDPPIVVGWTYDVVVSRSGLTLIAMQARP
jgi:hypothetical protein